MAALAVPKPPVKWYLRSRPDNPTADEERAKTTPDRFRTMCRAVAVAELEVRFDACQIGRVKPPHGIWMSGFPCRSPRIQTALEETSMPPAFSATASARSSTACSSRALSCAVSATPPAGADLLGHLV